MQLFFCKACFLQMFQSMFQSPQASEYSEYPFWYSTLQSWFINFYTVVPFGILDHSLCSCSYSTRQNHPGRQYLTVPSCHSSLYKSNILAIVLLSMLLRSRMKSLIVYIVQHSPRLACLQKRICHSLPVTPVSSWYGLVISLN